MPTLSNAHALVIGIAEYQHIRKLPPFRDATAIAELLANEAQGGYPPANVRLRQDGEATKTTLVADLAALATASDADSTVFISFSGHGAREADGAAAREYLLPVDFDPTSTETVAATAISDTEFAAAVAAIPARKVVIVLDCCHSGGIGEPRDAAAPALREGVSEEYMQRLAQGKGRVIFAAARDTELSVQLHGEDFGLFTKHLLAGLQGGVASDDGMVRIFDLFTYVQPLVTKENPLQHPVFKAEIEENFAVALWQGGAKGVIPRDVEGYRYDAYVSYADREPDAAWVNQTLLPRLEQEGLRVAISEDVEVPGVDRVVNFERGITEAKRTVVVLSDAYLADTWADFESVLAMTIGIKEGTYRLLPVVFEPVADEQVPEWLDMLSRSNLTDSPRRDRNFDRLVEALQGPLPRR